MSSDTRIQEYLANYFEGYLSYMPTEFPSLVAEQLPRYFVVYSRGDGSIREWNLSHWDKTWPVDCRYYGQVFQHMERFLTVPNLRFYLTWDVDNIPQYGPNVVILLCGDEFGRIPRYARFVNSIFKTPPGTMPRLGIRRWFPFDALRRNLVLKYLRNLTHHARSRWKAARARFPIAPVLPEPHILNTPFGTAMLDDLPLRPMRERSYHCFFAGSLEMEPPRGMAALKESPKLIARRAMVNSMLALEKRNPHFRADLTVFGKTVFGQQDGITRSYSERMMDSKICLAPRGTIIDTWRFFEGLKSGCMVVSEPLPDEYYYRGAPVIQIDSWNQLEKIITPMLDDDETLERWSARSLEYWKTVCGEEAIGRRVAEFISKSPASQQLRSAANH